MIHTQPVSALPLPVMPATAAVASLLGLQVTFIISFFPCLAFLHVLLLSPLLACVHGFFIASPCPAPHSQLIPIPLIKIKRTENCLLTDYLPWPCDPVRRATVVWRHGSESGFINLTLDQSMFRLWCWSLRLSAFLWALELQIPIFCWEGESVWSYQHSKWSYNFWLNKKPAPGFLA